MLRATLKSSSVATQLLNRAVVFGFCYNWAPLDPRKHTTMSHSIHNMYIDLYNFGQYPDWYHVCSTPPKTYEPKVLSLIAQTINTRYGTKITTDDLLSKRNRAWDRFLSKDLKVQESFYDLYPTILSKLATGIFVKQSRLTWLIEQKTRFTYTMESFDANSPETIGDFLERYNENIQELVLLSNFGFAAQIDQASSALEKHQTQEHQNSSPGVQELKKLSKEHDNILNKLLAFIH